MAKLELPIRAFVEDFCKRAFPDRNWNRGSGVNDLVIKPMAVLLQPLRHEIDTIKVGQSITNYQYMRRTDLDALAANWGKFRQRGSKSQGNVRIYFDTASEYRFSYLEFFAADGTTFVLQSPVSIGVSDLLARRRTDGLFFFDVAVQSVGVGNRYALPAGSIIGVRNAPSGIVRVENTEDFAVTAPDESNFDVVNALFKNLGMRNLVSRASIRAPLLDSFAGIIDLFIAGADHIKMVRDLHSETIDGKLRTIHLGGMVDVWLNTSSLVQREVTLGYLPSSGKFRIVSAEEAAQNELMYSFAQSLLTIDGRYASPDYPNILLDESSGVLFDIAGIINRTFVIGEAFDDTYQLATTDVVSGTDLLVLPTPFNNGTQPGGDDLATLMQGQLLADLMGVNFLNTSVKAGDYVSIDGKFRKITRLSGRVFEVGPDSVQVASVVWDSKAGTLIISAGDRYIPIKNVDICQINDTAVIPSSAAAGNYKVLADSCDGIYVGNVVARGQLTYLANLSSPANQKYVYQLSSPEASEPILPLDVDGTCWIYMGDDGAYDQDPAKWFRIKEVARSAPGAINITTINGTTTPSGVISIVQGLRDAIPDQTPIIFEKSGISYFGRSTRGIFGNDTLSPTEATQHTLYANTVDDAITAGGINFGSIGLGIVASIGDMLIFDGNGIVPEASRVSTGGDGTKFTVVVDTIVDDDNITFRPALTFDIPSGTRYALMRNTKSLGSCTVNVDSIDTQNKTFEVDDFPMGLGDGTGMIMVDPEDNQYVVTRSTAGNLRQLSFNPPQQAVDIVLSPTGYVTTNPGDIGEPVTQETAGGIYAGTLQNFNNVTRTWTIVPNDITVDLFDSLTDPIEIEGSPATGIPSAPPGAPYAVGYFAPTLPDDKGLLVRQGEYIGVLDDVLDGYIWQIKPLSDFDLFDNVDLTTYVDYGNGTPTVTPTPKGYGTLREPATVPQLNTGSVVFTLDRAPEFSNGDTITIWSRFGLNGGFFDNNRWRVLDDPQINNRPFNGLMDDQVVDSDDKLLVLVGAGFDSYALSKVNVTDIETQDLEDPDFVRIANAPKPQPLPFVTPIVYGTTQLNLPGSNMGFWAQHGRVLVIYSGGAQYNLVIDGPLAPNNADGIVLLDPIPVTLYPDQSVEWEIVEAFHVPFFLVAPEKFRNYRVIDVPSLGDIVYSGTKGRTAADEGFVDSSINFFSLIAGVDFESEDFLLYIDSGPDASVTPKIITGLASPTTLVLDSAFENTAEDIQYHVIRRNRARDREYWLNGQITDNNQITLDVPEDWDFMRNNTYTEWVFDIQPHPLGTPGLNMWTIPPLTGTYDPDTKVLTVSAASGTVSPNTAFTVPDGFDNTLLNEPCRIMPRLVDRVAEHRLGGSAVNTFNYYLRDYFTLPIVRIQSVDLLNPQTLESVKSLDYRLIVNDPGLRYSSTENNSIEILSPDVEDALLQPVKVRYLSDLSIEAINQYVNNDDTRVLNSNQLVKRQETIAVDLSVKVRSEEKEATVGSKLASFVNTLRSVDLLSKDKIIKYLYQNNVVSYIEVASLKLSGTYYQQDGVNIDYDDVDNLFGADTACYLARTITVTKLTEQVGA